MLFRLHTLHRFFLSWLFITFGSLFVCFIPDGQVFLSIHFFVVAYNTDAVENGYGSGDAYISQCVFAGILLDRIVEYREGGERGGSRMS